MAARKLQEVPYVLDVAGRSRGSCFDQHVEVVVAVRRELVLVVVPEREDRKMVEGRRGGSHDLLAQNRRSPPSVVLVEVVDQGLIESLRVNDGHGLCQQAYQHLQLVVEPQILVLMAALARVVRSEERRVGKECPV